MAVIRAKPEDFEVDELPLYQPCGEGPFAWLWIEKRLRNTDDVARDLAFAFGLRPKHVGYTGRKDHRAVTRQWLSVPAAKDADFDQLEIEGVQVLDVHRHSHRLRLGDLLGNRFRIVVRDVEVDAAASATERFDQLVQRGLPNRFGAQRFGRDGRNAERGRAILAGEATKSSRNQAKLMLNALQSAVFNAVVDERGKAISEVWQGDVVHEHRSGDQRWSQASDDDIERASKFEISATGPLFGSKMKRPQGRVAELEQRVTERFDLPSADHLPRSLHLYGARRPLRVPVRSSGLTHDGDVVRIEFDLPPGSYATVLLDALF